MYLINLLTGYVLYLTMSDNKKNINKIPRQEMPKQAPDVRRHNFGEVACGYTEKEALLEASRCIQCKRKRTTKVL